MSPHYGIPLTLMWTWNACWETGTTHTNEEKPFMRLCLGEWIHTSPSGQTFTPASAIAEPRDNTQTSLENPDLSQCPWARHIRPLSIYLNIYSVVCKISFLFHVPTLPSYWSNGKCKTFQSNSYQDLFSNLWDFYDINVFYGSLICTGNGELSKLLCNGGSLRI